MTQQTAVDWLVKRFLLSGNNLLISDVEIAKQMEKEQIMNAYNDGEHQQGYEGEAEQYYNETYGK